jgi:hypothetical protein
MADQPQQKDRKVLVELTEVEAKRLLQSARTSRAYNGFTAKAHDRAIEKLESVLTEGGDDQGDVFLREASGQRARLFLTLGAAKEGLECAPKDPWREVRPGEWFARVLTRAGGVDHTIRRVPIPATLPSPSQEDGERFEEAVEAACKAQGAAHLEWMAGEEEMFTEETSRGFMRAALTAARPYLQPGPTSQQNYLDSGLSEEERELLKDAAGVYEWRARKYEGDDREDLEKRAAVLRNLANKSEAN